ncbi:phage tail protein [Neisseria polysaccharea]|uniref:phage tail protein n=1 Tax=Neisseria polysaccharea TaxID=489 RepID=UPI00272C5233|nr:phage tail protein [Neisseria polysaccharea]
MPQPKLLSKAWASDGLKNSIPDTRSAGMPQEGATYADGFPSITMTPISTGGKPPSGKDMNGVLYEISAHTVWQNQGGRYRFDQAFCEAVGGYPKGAVLINDTLDTEYISLVDANTHNPNNGGNTGKWAIHAGKGLKAGTAQAGIVQLSSATGSNSEDMAATPKAVKAAYDKAVESAGKGIPVGAIVAFPRSVSRPEGFLKADGTTFAQNTFPDLYRALGNSNRLPDLSRTDIGITAWFPSDRIPSGWLAFDDIRTRVTETAYPELYRLLVAKYGSIRNVPQAEDRFIRNAGNGLAVGQTQGDAIRNITGKIDSGNRSNEQLFDTAIPEGAFGIDKARKNWTYDGDGGGSDRPSAITFDASRVVPTADENRPKALVLKLCIKAADTLGEAVFWIKSHGETVNAGALDAGTLAQGLQDKADRDHTHTAAQIQGLNEKISAVTGGIFGNSAAATGWQKLPGGILIQWGKNNINGVHRSNTVYFPVSFGEVWSISTATHTPNSSFYGNMAAGVTIRNYSESSLVIDYHSCYETAGGSGVSVSWIAIGKAASGNAASPPSTVPGIPEIDEETRREIERLLASTR